MNAVRIADERESGTIPNDSSPANLVGRTMQILDALMGEDRGMTLSDLARRVALPKSTVFRIVNQLTESGYLTRVDRNYWLSSRLFRLGNSVSIPHHVPLQDVAVPHLAGLFQHTGFGVNLAVLDGVANVLYLDTIRGVRISTAAFRVGATMPALVTALGKVIVAHSDDETINKVLATPWPRRTSYTVVSRGLMAGQLRDARVTGIAYDLEESVLGLVCVAAPVLGPDGRPIGAVSACGPSGRFKPEAAIQPTLRAARLISNDFARAVRLKA